MKVWLLSPHFDREGRYWPAGSQPDWTPNLGTLTADMLPLDTAATAVMDATYTFKSAGTGRYVRK